VDGFIRGLRVVFYSYLPARDCQLPLGKELDCLRVYPVLLFQYPFRQTICGIVIMDGDDGLDDYRSRVDAGIGEVYGTTGEFYTVIKGLLLSVEAWE